MTAAQVAAKGLERMFSLGFDGGCWSITSENESRGQLFSFGPGRINLVLDSGRHTSRLTFAGLNRRTANSDEQGSMGLSCSPDVLADIHKIFVAMNKQLDFDFECHRGADAD